mmetsp:Transcript_31902/g.42224  ORF Transcript_31902/g.42224 Transcript_31902/m.42224 type:complete len:200 (-) Transcript_31902:2448-3047(-)
MCQATSNTFMLEEAVKTMQLVAQANIRAVVCKVRITRTVMAVLRNDRRSRVLLVMALYTGQAIIMGRRASPVAMQAATSASSTQLRSLTPSRSISMRLSRRQRNCHTQAPAGAPATMRVARVGQAATATEHAPQTSPPSAQALQVRLALTHLAPPPCTATRGIRRRRPVGIIRIDQNATHIIFRAKAATHPVVAISIRT